MFYLKVNYKCKFCYYLKIVGVMCMALWPIPPPPTSLKPLETSMVA